MNTVLHIINCTQYGSDLESGPFAMMSEKDAVILIENGVYHAISTVENRTLTGAVSGVVYVLLPDLHARGINQQSLLADVKPVDYDGFVDLTAQFSTSVSW